MFYIILYYTSQIVLQYMCTLLPFLITMWLQRVNILIAFSQLDAFGVLCHVVNCVL